MNTKIFRKRRRETSPKEAHKADEHIRPFLQSQRVGVGSRALRLA